MAVARPRSSGSYLVLCLLLLLLAAKGIDGFALDGVNSLKRFSVTCASAILEGILELTPRTDKEFWTTCRHDPIPPSCQSSCGGIRLRKDASHERVRACWLCLRWRTFHAGEETSWTWAPMLISACEYLGFGDPQRLVNAFTEDEELYSIALRSVRRKSNEPIVYGGGGGGAGVEIWCGDLRLLWLGGGGGGGARNFSSGRGTGAGMQSMFGWALGGGGGGGMKKKLFDDGTTRKESYSFGYEKDALTEEGYREATSQDIIEMRVYIQECYRKNALSIFGTGGSGGSDGRSFNIRFNLTSCDASDWN